MTQSEKSRTKLHRALAFYLRAMHRAERKSWLYRKVCGRAYRREVMKRALEIIYLQGKIRHGT